MGRRTSYAPGTFSAVDLVTPDPEAAASFYARLFGWQGEDLPVGEGATYTMLRRDGATVAGLYAGSRPGWLSYVTVDDVDGCTERARELGGAVRSGPRDVLDAGRMAVIADPQGAVLALWQPRRHHGAEVVNEPGALTWNDLLTGEVEAAAAFYRDLFGWDVEQIGDMPYWTIRNRGASNGGMLPMPPEQQAAGAPPVWNVYFAVEDLPAAARTAEEAGATLVAGPLEVPAGRFAVVRDPLGAVFSLFAGELDA